MSAAIELHPRELTVADALDILRGLDGGIIEIRDLAARFDDDADVDGGGVWTWSARVLIGGCWYFATVPDHYADGAEIDWSSCEQDGGAR